MAEPEYETEHHWNVGDLWGSSNYESNATYDDGHTSKCMGSQCRRGGGERRRTARPATLVVVVEASFTPAPSIH